MDIFQPSGNMVVDIGGGTTDVAVLSMGDVVTASSIKVAGDKFDAAIMKYIKNKYKLLIGERTSEGYQDQDRYRLSDGQRCRDGHPRTRYGIRSAADRHDPFQESARSAMGSGLVDRCCGQKSVLERTPPELSADIIDRGVILTGGGALLDGLDAAACGRTEGSGAHCGRSDALRR